MIFLSGKYSIDVNIDGDTSHGEDLFQSQSKYVNNSPQETSRLLL